MGHHQEDQHTYHGRPGRMREKEPEQIFKEIMAENFPNVGVPWWPSG